MQVLQAFGQQSDARDYLPIKGPGSAETENSEHPFIKLLAQLQNASKQESESNAKVVNPDEVSVSGSAAQVKARSGSAVSPESDEHIVDRSIQAQPYRANKDQSLEAQQANGQPNTARSEQLALNAVKASAILHAEKSGSTAKTGREKIIAGEPGKAPGNTSRKLQAVDEKPSVNPQDSDTQNKTGEHKPEQALNRSSSLASPELMSRHKRLDLVGKAGDPHLTTAAAANVATGSLGLNRNVQLDFSEKAGQSAKVGESRDTLESGRRPSRFSVVDMRLKAATQKGRVADSSDAKPSGLATGSAAADFNRNGLTGIDAAGRNLNNDQSANGFADSSKGFGAEAGDRPAASFAENLATRLRDGGSMDIVRSAQIVLKDGDAGLIRLRLDPESLGGVKIELKMADKQISARIIVESDLAGQAFRSSLDSLRDAFASSGFETTSIEVEVRDGQAGTADSGSGGGDDDGTGDNQDPYTARKVGEFGDAVPAADAAYRRYGMIDLVV